MTTKELIAWITTALVIATCIVVPAHGCQRAMSEIARACLDAGHSPAECRTMEMPR